MFRISNALQNVIDTLWLSVLSVHGTTECRQLATHLGFEQRVDRIAAQRVHNRGRVLRGRLFHARVLISRLPAGRFGGGGAPRNTDRSPQSQSCR